MIDHHLPDEWLMDYASGAASEPVALLVATHLAMCAACRASLARIEAVGGAMLDDLAPEPVRAGALAETLALLNDKSARGSTARAPSRLPAPLAAYVPAEIDDLSWRMVTRGVEEAALACAGGGYTASLLRFAPKRAIPHHTHRGDELVVVLEGGFSDEFGHFGPGDVSLADEAVEHRPVADGDRDCLCLFVTSGPIRLTGRFARLLNPFLPR